MSGCCSLMSLVSPMSASRSYSSLDFLIVFTDVEFPFAAPHGFDAVAFVVKERFVLRCCAFFCEHERADVFAVDDAVGGYFCSAEGCKCGVKVHG